MASPDRALSPEELAEERFLAAAHRQMAFERRGEETYGAMFRSAESYATHVSRQTRWVVEGLIPEGFLAILGGSSKAGKTCLATALGMSIATGEPFLGMNVHPGGVLWCAYEESESERLGLLSQWPDHPPRFYVTHEKPLIDDEYGLEALAYWVYKTDAKLIVIDPLYGATSAESLSDGRVARRVLTGLKELCVRQRCAALVLHHITKDVSVGLVRERFADSNQILATASMDLLMDSSDHPQGGRILKIACRGRGEFANQILYVHSKGVTHFERISAAEAELPNLSEARLLAHLKTSPAPLDAVKIAEALDLPAQSVRNRLTNLVRKGRVEAHSKRGHANLYTVTTSSSL